MDYRNRRYFLIALSNEDLNEITTKFLADYNSVKFYSPYNHIRQYNPKNKSGKNFENMRYDGEYKSITGLGYVQQMLSCSNEEAFFVEMDLKELAARRPSYNKFIEITKDMLGQ